MGPESKVAQPRSSAITIGAYDGVHLGHRHLIGELVRMAAERDLRSVVVTFDRHPAEVVRPQSAPLVLTDLDQKLELLATTGVDETMVVTFDEKRANESAEDFVLEVLVGALGAGLVVVGKDFHFGHGRKGNVALLTEMGSQYGFDVFGLGLEEDPSGEVVSSTRIRKALAAGDVRGASFLLGRYHQVRGVVVKESRIGASQLGFLTADVEVPPDIALPADGVYACWYERPDGTLHGAAVSIAPGRRALEALVLDCEGDLPGERAKVCFVDRLRSERRLDSGDELVSVMEGDTEDTRAVLAREPRMS